MSSSESGAFTRESGDLLRKPIKESAWRKVERALYFEISAELNKYKGDAWKAKCKTEGVTAPTFTNLLGGNTGCRPARARSSWAPS